MDIKQILAKGKLELRVHRQGAFQKQEFVVLREPFANSSYPVLFLDKFLDFDECVRLANEVGLPIKTKNGVFFPTGKSAKDFLGL